MTSINTVNNSFSSTPVSYSSVLSQLAYVGVPSDPALYQDWVNAMLSAVPNTVDPNQVSQVFQVQAANGTTNNVTITAAQLGISGTVSVKDKLTIWQNFLSSFSASNPMPTTLASFNNAWLAFIRSGLTDALASSMASQIITNQQTAQLLQNQIQATQAQVASIQNFQNQSATGAVVTGTLTLQQQKDQSISAITQDLQALTPLISSSDANAIQGILTSWNYQGDLQGSINTSLGYFNSLASFLSHQATGLSVGDPGNKVANIYDDMLTQLNKIQMLNRMKAASPPIAMGSIAQIYAAILVQIKPYLGTSDPGANQRLQRLYDDVNGYLAGADNIFFSEVNDAISSVRVDFYTPYYNSLQLFQTQLQALNGGISGIQPYHLQLQNLILPNTPSQNGLPYSPSGQLKTLSAQLAKLIPAGTDPSTLKGLLSGISVLDQNGVVNSSYVANGLTLGQQQLVIADVNAITTALDAIPTQQQALSANIAIINNAVNDLASYVDPAFLSPFKTYASQLSNYYLVQAATSDIATLSAQFLNNIAQIPQPLPSNESLISLVTDLQAQLAGIKTTDSFLSSLISDVQSQLLSINAALLNQLPVDSLALAGVALGQLMLTIEIAAPNILPFGGSTALDQLINVNLRGAYQLALTHQVYPISSADRANITTAQNAILQYLQDNTGNDFTNTLQPVFATLDSAYLKAINESVIVANIPTTGIYPALATQNLTAAGAAYVASGGSSVSMALMSSYKTLMQLTIGQLSANATNVNPPATSVFNNSNDVTYRNMFNAIQSSVQVLITQANAEASGINGYAVQLTTINSQIQQQLAALQTTLDQANVEFVNHPTDQNLILLKALIPQAIALLPPLVSQAQPLGALSANASQEAGTSTNLGSGTFASQLTLAQQLLSNIALTSVAAHTTYNSIAVLDSSFTAQGTEVLTTLNNLPSAYNSNTITSAINSLNSQYSQYVNFQSSAPYLSDPAPIGAYIQQQIALYQQLQSQVQVAVSTIVNVSSSLGLTGLTAGTASTAIINAFQTLSDNAALISRSSSDTNLNRFLAVLIKNLPLTQSGITNTSLSTAITNTPALTPLLAIRSQLANLDTNAPISGPLYDAIVAFQAQLRDAFNTVQAASFFNANAYIAPSSTQLGSVVGSAIQGVLDQLSALTATNISSSNVTVGNTPYNLGMNLQAKFNALLPVLLETDAPGPQTAQTANNALNAINQVLSNIGSSSLLTSAQSQTLFTNIANFNAAINSIVTNASTIILDLTPIQADIDALKAGMKDLEIRVNRMISSGSVANQLKTLNDKVALYTQELAGIPGVNLYPVVTPTSNVGATITALPLSLSNIAINPAFPSGVDPVAALSTSIGSALQLANDIPNYTAPSNAQITTFFNNFARTYNSSGTQNQTTFFNQLGNSLAIFAGVQTGTSLPIGTGTAGTTQQDLLRFQNVYNAIFPNSNASYFNAAFQTFYDQAVKTNGLFIPSQEFSSWVSSLQTTSASAGGVFTDTTSLASIGADKVLILNNIYALIGTMLKAMQKITALQADRLNILTTWQQAYTEALGQMPTFLISGPASWIGSIAGDINTNFNQVARTTMTTNQGIVSDDAKAMQSTINQSNSAVSTQSNMAQTIITQLTTILGSIFK